MATKYLIVCFEKAFEYPLGEDLTDEQIKDAIARVDSMSYRQFQDFLNDPKGQMTGEVLVDVFVV